MFSENASVQPAGPLPASSEHDASKHLPRLTGTSAVPDSQVKQNMNALQTEAGPTEVALFMVYLVVLICVLAILCGLLRRFRNWVRRRTDPYLSPTLPGKQPPMRRNSSSYSNSLKDLERNAAEASNRQVAPPPQVNIDIPSVPIQPSTVEVDEEDIPVSIHSNTHYITRPLSPIIEESEGNEDT